MAANYSKEKKQNQSWLIKEEEFSKSWLNKYESLFALGNGYLGLRGTTEEAYLKNWKGLYLAGTYDKFPDEVTELPNLPDPLMTEIFISGERIDLTQGKILDYERVLNLKTGELVRSFIWESNSGKKASLTWRRFVSMSDKHLLSLKLEITPLNFKGTVKICSGINGQVTNSGVQHFIEKDLRYIKENNLYYLTARTQQSGYDIIVAANHSLYTKGSNMETKDRISTDRRKICQWQEFEAEIEKTIVFEKKAYISSSRDQDLKTDKNKFQPRQLQERVINLAKKYNNRRYESLRKQHSEIWAEYWEDMDIKLEAPEFDQLAVRFALFHIIQMTPHHDERLSIPAKGLTGEGYKGHIFWDMESFIFPFFIQVFPEKARKLLKYRYHTLDGARNKAKKNGYEGAMYAWESALSGEETTPKCGAVDVKTGEAIRIWCGELEQHITADIAKALFDYLEITGDYSFIEEYGAEMLIEMARFWSSRLEYNAEKDIYEINDVIGPDEYSERIDNNSYTNYLVHWQLKKTGDLIDDFAKYKPEKFRSLSNKIDFTREEIFDWIKKAEKIKLPQPDKNNIISQFDGFFDREDIDLTKFDGNKGEIVSTLGWENVNRYKLIKQADIVMLMHQLDEYFSDEIKRTNYNYYEPKTLHDSSLSPAIHSIIAAKLNYLDEAYDFFARAARIDLGEGENNSSHGLHSASLGGLWQSVVLGFAGLKLKSDKIIIDPRLPADWNLISFKFNWQGIKFKLIIEADKIALELIAGELNDRLSSTPLEVRGEQFKLKDFIDKADLTLEKKKEGEVSS